MNANAQRSRVYTFYHLEVVYVLVLDSSSSSSSICGLGEVGRSSVRERERW